VIRSADGTLLGQRSRIGSENKSAASCCYARLVMQRCPRRRRGSMSFGIGRRRQVGSPGGFEFVWYTVHSDLPQC